MKNKLALISLCMLAAASSSLAETNYVALQNKCQGETNPGCCISSVRVMRDGKFQQATDGKCPDGYTAQMYRCDGSLSWCEPKEDSAIAVNGGSMNYRKEAKEPKKDKDKIVVDEVTVKEDEITEKKK